MHPEIIAKAEGIQLLILDVDGILTSGAIYYLSQGMEMRCFNIHDGLGIKLLQKVGMPIAIISAKKNEMVERRLTELNIVHQYLGYENKLPAYHELKQKLNLTNKQIAYMGDDLPDLPILLEVGLSITVPQAPDLIKQHVDLITTKKGGKGAVREVCELILKAKNQYQHVIQSYFAK